MNPDEFPWRRFVQFSREEFEWIDAGERLAAYERSREVARATLGEKQYARLCRRGYVVVEPRGLAAANPQAKGRKVYTLRPGQLPRCDYADGRREYLCLGPRYPMPDYDFLAVMYLRLRDDEAATRRAANMFSTSHRPPNTFGKPGAVPDEALAAMASIAIGLGALTTVAGIILFFIIVVLPAVARAIAGAQF